MARHTSLFQTPRSPLIQGRTRWERPLWQAWAAGGVVSVAATSLFLAFGPARSAWTPAIVAAAVLGSGVGALMARWWGWRQRWVGALVGGLVFAAVTFAIAASV